MDAALQVAELRKKLDAKVQNVTNQASGISAPSEQEGQEGREQRATSFASNTAKLSDDPEVIDYVSARKETGSVTGRVVKSFGVIAALLFAMGVYRGSLPDNPDMGDSASMALIWYFLAVVFAAVALLVGYTTWVRTGRVR
jgi:hypothetical protein